MGFKLIRIDDDSNGTYILPLGSHVVGRGRFLDCNDNRVSRNHAELIVTSESILLKSLHQNPCFVKKKSSSETMTFSQPESQVLINGDQFGLVSDNYWYEVQDQLQDSPDENTDVTNMPQNLNGTKNVSETQPYNDEDKDILNYSQSCSVNGSSNTSLLNEVFDEPFNLSQENQAAGKNMIEQPTESSSQSEDSIIQPAEATNQQGDPTYQHIEPISPSKRLHFEDDSPYDIKKVKKEPEESCSNDCDQANAQTSDESVGSTSNPAVNTEPNSPQESRPSTSNEQEGCSTTGANNRPVMPPSPTEPPNNPLRERCMYGATCYRRNLQHMAQFSHPADADWGTGARGVCPWGAACRRADPRHWRDHDHPPGVQPPPPQQHRGNWPGMQEFHRRGNNVYINVNTVYYYDNHFEVEESDSDSSDDNEL